MEKINKYKFLMKIDGVLSDEKLKNKQKKTKIVKILRKIGKRLRKNN